MRTPAATAFWLATTLLVGTASPIGVRVRGGRESTRTRDSCRAGAFSSWWACSATTTTRPSSRAGSRSGRAVKLFDETGRELAAADSGGDGKVRFDLEPAKLGAPGAGKLVARFAGNADLEAASEEQAALREATVALELDSVSGSDAGGSA